MRTTPARGPDRPAPALQGGAALPVLSRRLALALAACAFGLAPASAESFPAAPTRDASMVLQELRDMRLEPGRAVAVSNVRLAMGAAVAELTQGVVVPATPVGGAVVEVVFVGQGVLRAEPPDAIEAGQLELFTGSASLEAPFEEAVFTLARQEAAAALLDRPVTEASGAALRQAEARYREWRQGPRRRHLGVEGNLFANAMGDPLRTSYFAAWLVSESLGDFLNLVDPLAGEQVTIGQFVPLDLTTREQREAAREIGREQRRGRLVGLALDDLGYFDTWMSASLLAEGAARPGFEPFEPERYVLAVELGRGRAEALHGRAQVHLRPATRVATVATLRLHRDLAVESVRRSEVDLLFHRDGSDLYVVLGDPPSPEETLVLTVEYGGSFLDRVERSYAVRHPLGWYPRAGGIDRARYDVTLRWPRSLDLVAAGRRVDGGEEGRVRWERRTIEHPVLGFGFEVGSFDVVSRSTSGGIPVRVAFDRDSRRHLPREVREEIVETAVGSLELFSESFGPYPYGELTVVTVPRLYSQALPGFVTLSQIMMADLGVFNLLLGLEDRRTVVAHEVAHQWWGNLVGWAGYRDQWLSEALASYSALHYARQRLGRIALGPTHGWQHALTAELEDGRPLEAIGPVVLGPRLASSKAPDAYGPIVYKKGAVIIDMMTQMVSEEGFLEIMRALVEAASHQVISTEQFLMAVSRASGADLEGFGSQFVFGTGLPEVYYDVRFEAAGPGKWRVIGEARQVAPYRYGYRAELRSGGWDVRRERIEHAPGTQWVLPTPVEVAVWKADAPAAAEASRRRRDPRPDWNAVIHGRMLLRGESTGVDFEIDSEPKDFWLDRTERVYARFYDGRRHPRRVLFFQGLDLMAAGEAAQAESLLRRALEAPAVAAGQETPDPARVRVLDGRIHLALARLHLDQERDAEAEKSLAEARRLLRGHWYGRREHQVVEARWNLRRGEYDRVYRSLRKSAAEIDSAEGYLLLAVAARELGRAAELERALASAQKKGAEVSGLARGR